MKSRPLLALVCFLMMSTSAFSQEDVQFFNADQLTIMRDRCFEAYEHLQAAYYHACLQGVHFISDSPEFASPTIDSNATIRQHCSKPWLYRKREDICVAAARYAQRRLICNQPINRIESKVNEFYECDSLLENGWPLTEENQ